MTVRPIPPFFVTLYGGGYAHIVGCKVLQVSQEGMMHVAEGGELNRKHAEMTFDLASPTSLRALADILEASGAK